MFSKPVFENLQVVLDMRVLGKSKEKKHVLLRDVEPEKFVGLYNKKISASLLTQLLKLTKLVN